HQPASCSRPIGSPGVAVAFRRLLALGALPGDTARLGAATARPDRAGLEDARALAAVKRRRCLPAAAVQLSPRHLLAARPPFPARTVPAAQKLPRCARRIVADARFGQAPALPAPCSLARRGPA